MFKNVLVPTDGSDLSRNAAAQAAKLAKATGARLTAFYVAEPHAIRSRGEDGATLHRYVSAEDHAVQVAAEATEYLDIVKRLAAASGVECSGYYVMNSFPARAIVHAAEAYGCDGIIMASHGRSGLKKLLLGGNTLRVLASAELPVLVVR